MPLFVKTSARLIALVLVSASFFSIPALVDAQSIAPGTGRAWKRNPPKTVKPTNLQGVVDDAQADAAKLTAEQAKNSVDALVEAKSQTVRTLSATALKAQQDAANAEALAKVKSDTALQAQLESRLAQTAAMDALSSINAEINAAPNVPGSKAAKPPLSSQALSEIKTRASTADVTRKAKAAAAEAAQTDAAKASEDAKAKTTAATDATTAAVNAQADLAKAQTDAATAQSKLDAATATAQSALTFDDTAQGATSFHAFKVHYPKAMPSSGNTLAILISADGDTDRRADFKQETSCKADSNGNVIGDSDCVVVVGFHPSIQGKETVKLSILINGAAVAGSGVISGSGTSGKFCEGPRQGFLPLTRKPVDTDVADKGQQALRTQLKIDFGAASDAVYCFYQQSGPVAYLSQVKSIYNSAAGSNTIKPDLGSLAFLGGVQLAIATNVETGTSSSTPAASSTPIPSLTSTQAAQAAQNLVNGGNLLVRATWPALYISSAKSNFLLSDYVVAREGLDIPNFSGANTVATDPVSHFNASDEFYFQFDALSATQGGSDSAGSLFLDGRLGYNDVSHSFGRQAGFGNRGGSASGQVTAGIVITGVVSVAAQRNFGPAQRWTDSTTDKLTTANNFRGWSIAVSVTPKKSSNTKN